MLWPQGSMAQGTKRPGAATVTPFINPTTGKPIILSGAQPNKVAKVGAKPTVQQGIRPMYGAQNAMQLKIQQQQLEQKQRWEAQKALKQKQQKQQTQQNAAMQFMMRQQQMPNPQMFMAKQALGGTQECTGEIRFESPDAVQKALLLNGSQLGGVNIKVQLDSRSPDGTKITVSGLQSTHKWQDLKDFFAQCGKVCFANISAGSADTPVTGEVRFETAQQAQQAVALSGSIVGGHQVQIAVHTTSKDGTKLQITNLPPGCQWQELKDFFKNQGLIPNFVQTTTGMSVSTAEVRYQDASGAQMAVQRLNNSTIGTGTITVQLDPSSPDGVKVLVSNIAPGINWQEVKDHFAQVGAVAFCQVNKPGEGKGAQGGMAAGMAAMMGGMGGMFGGCGGMGGGCGGMAMLPNGMIMTPAGVVMQANAMQGMGLGAGMAMSGGIGGMQPGTTGEVRMEGPAQAQLAAQTLNGSNLNGANIIVNLNQGSPDGTKLHVNGLAFGTTWQQLKDHFGAVGTVCFAKVN